MQHSLKDIDKKAHQKTLMAFFKHLFLLFIKYRADPFALLQRVLFMTKRIDSICTSPHSPFCLPFFPEDLNKSRKRNAFIKGRKLVERKDIKQKLNHQVTTSDITGDFRIQQSSLAVKFAAKTRRTDFYRKNVFRIFFLCDKNSSGKVEKEIEEKMIC